MGKKLPFSEQLHSEGGTETGGEFWTVNTVELRRHTYRKTAISKEGF